MKSLTNSYSAFSPSLNSALYQAPIEICCELNRIINTSTTIITEASQFTLNARIKQLLDEFENLDDNWDNDDALAPTKDSISKARFLTYLFNKHGQLIFHAAPGPNGEVMIDVRNKRKNKSIEFIFYKNKSIYVSLSSNESPKQGNFDDENLPEIMNWLNCVENE